MTFPVFSAGEVLDAADMNAVGLWLVKTQAVTGGNAATVVTGAFSADYDAYKVVVSNGACSAANISILLTLGSTVSGYSYGALFGGVSGSGGFGGASEASFLVGEANTNQLQSNFELQNPFLAKHTTIGTMPSYNVSNNNMRVLGGVLGNTTSYTAFTLTLSAGATFTNGTIRVYGMRN
jgi:hypothetical protein